MDDFPVCFFGFLHVFSGFCCFLHYLLDGKVLEWKRFFRVENVFWTLWRYGKTAKIRWFFGDFRRILWICCRTFLRFLCVLLWFLRVSFVDKEILESISWVEILNTNI